MLVLRYSEESYRFSYIILYYIILYYIILYYIILYYIILIILYYNIIILHKEREEKLDTSHEH